MRSRGGYCATQNGDERTRAGEQASKRASEQAYATHVTATHVTATHVTATLPRTFSTPPWARSIVIRRAHKVSSSNVFVGSVTSSLSMEASACACPTWRGEEGERVRARRGEEGKR
jgi:hypothetical protein